MAFCSTVYDCRTGWNCARYLYNLNYGLKKYLKNVKVIPERVLVKGYSGESPTVFTKSILRLFDSMLQENAIVLLIAVNGLHLIVWNAYLTKLECHQQLWRKIKIGLQILVLPNRFSTKFYFWSTQKTLNMHTQLCHYFDI